MFSAFLTLLLAGERGSSRGPGSSIFRYPERVWASCRRSHFSHLAPRPSCDAWARFHGQPPLGPVLQHVATWHIMLHLHHHGVHNCGFRATSSRWPGPRPSSLSSSSTSTPCGKAASSLLLQLVVVFSHFSLLLEACYHCFMHKPGELAVSPACFRPVIFASCDSGLFERLVFNHICFYLESQNLAFFAQAGFRPSVSMTGQVLLLFQSFWEASSVGGSDRTVWPPLISLELLFGSGIQLSFTNYWFWFFRLALFGPICRRKNSGPLPWCSRPLVPSRTRCRSSATLWRFPVAPKSVGVSSLMRTPVGFRIGPGSLWLALLLHLSSF